MHRTIVPLCLLAALAVPAAASAQSSPSWFVSPFVGLTTGGDTTVEAPAVGVSGGWMGRRLGFEGELADAPEFFEQDGFRTYRRMTTLMGNVLYAPVRAGAVSVFGTGGLGLVRPHLAEAGDLARVEVRKPGMNVGGGVMAEFTPHSGIRADVRYFRTMRESADDANPFGLDLSKFRFWRASVGLAVRF